MLNWKNLILVCALLASPVVYGSTAKNQWVPNQCKSLFQSSLPSSAMSQLRDLMNIIPTKSYALRDDVDPGKKKLSEYIDDLLQMREEQSEALRRLLDRKDISSYHRSLIQNGSNKLDKDLSDNRRALQRKLSSFSSDMFLDQFWTLSQFDSRARQIEDNMMVMMKASRGGLAELLVSLQLQDVNGTEIHIREILKKVRPSFLRQYENQQVVMDALNLEMDVVANRNQDWIEVKSYNSQSSYGLRFFEKSLMKKADRVKSLLDFIEKKTGKKHYYHIVIVGTGRLSDAFKKKLNEKGCYIHEILEGESLAPVLR